MFAELIEFRVSEEDVNHVLLGFPQSPPQVSLSSLTKTAQTIKESSNRAWDAESDIVSIIPKLPALRIIEEEETSRKTASKGHKQKGSKGRRHP